MFANLDRAGKGDGRLMRQGPYSVVRYLGECVGLAVRPHGLRHTAITEACNAPALAGLGLEQVRDFSRHADVRALMIYRHLQRNVQGQLAALVAEAAG